MSLFCLPAGCSTYNNDFTTFADADVAGYDLYWEESQSIDSCKQLCLDRALCSAANYAPSFGNGSCFLKEKQWLDEASVSVTQGLHFFQRGCSW